MRVFAAQYDSMGGPRLDKSFRLVLTVDETQSKALFDLVSGTPKGTEFVFLAFETNKEEEEVKELVTETEEQTKTRLNKRMYVLLRNRADEMNKDITEIKKVLKKYLIQKKYIKESTSELDVKGLAAAIYYLQNNN